MEDEVRKELATIKGMVLHWKRDYLGWASLDGGGEFLARELSEEIETHVFPYVRRMYECNYLSDAEVKEFLERCYGEVRDLQNALEEMGAKQHRAKGG